MENLWETIAKARGVEIKEEFLYSLDGAEYRYRINGKGLEMYEDGHWYPSSRSNAFIKGEGKIEREPFVPKMGETYWSYHDEVKPCNYTWTGCLFDCINKITGIVFRTKEEAEDYLPTFKERLKEVGWLEE